MNNWGYAIPGYGEWSGEWGYGPWSAAPQSSQALLSTPAKPKPIFHYPHSQPPPTPKHKSFPRAQFIRPADGSLAAPPTPQLWRERRTREFKVPASLRRPSMGTAASAVAHTADFYSDKEGLERPRKRARIEEVTLEDDEPTAQPKSPRKAAAPPPLRSPGPKTRSSDPTTPLTRSKEEKMAEATAGEWCRMCAELSSSPGRLFAQTALRESHAKIHARQSGRELGLTLAQCFPFSQPMSVLSATTAAAAVATVDGPVKTLFEPVEAETASVEQASQPSPSFPDGSSSAHDETESTATIFGRGGPSCTFTEDPSEPQPLPAPFLLPKMSEQPEEEEEEEEEAPRPDEGPSPPAPLLRDCQLLLTRLSPERIAASSTPVKRFRFSSPPVSSSSECWSAPGTPTSAVEEESDSEDEDVLPRRFYALLSLHSRGDWTSRLCCDCGEIVKTVAAMEAHVYSHRRSIVLFSCLLCSKSAGSVRGSTRAAHLARKHPGLSQRQGRFEDHRVDQDETLAEALEECFPVQPFQHPLALLRKLAECENSRRTRLVCSFPNCPKPNLPRLAKKELFAHILSHANVNVFSCRQCSHKGNDILEHSRGQHLDLTAADDVLPDPTAWLDFEDHQTEHLQILLSLYQLCFKGGESRQHLNDSIFSVPSTSAARNTTPMRFLSLVSILRQREMTRFAKHASLPKPMCQFPMADGTACGVPIEDNFDFETHIYRHSRMNVFHCCDCRRNVMTSLHEHVRKKHRDEMPAYKDLRGGIEEKLIENAEACFTDLRSSRFVYPSRSSASLHAEYRRVAEISGIAGTLVCQFKNCGQRVRKAYSTLVVETHVLSHLADERLSGKAVFECGACSWEGVDVLAHATARHFRAPDPLLRPTEPHAWLCLSDHRRAFYADLIQRTLQKCFPPKKFSLDLLFGGASVEEEEPESPPPPIANDSQALDSEAEMDVAPEQEEAEVGSGTPRQLMSLLSALAGVWARSGGSPCTQCDWRAPEKGRLREELELHLMSHDSATVNFECKLCGAQYRQRDEAHLRDAHEGATTAAFIDLRSQRQNALCMLLKLCYPELETLDFWFQSRDRYGGLLVFERKVILTVEAASRLRQISCQFSGCKFSIPGTQLDQLTLHSHVLSHFELEVVECRLCFYRGTRVVQHVYEEHDVGALSELFVDSRQDHDAALNGLLALCFPILSSPA